LTQEIDDDDLERFLKPLLAEWNQLSPDELRSLSSASYRPTTGGEVSYVTEERTPYGYEYVELEIRVSTAFSMRLQLEGRPGGLSTETYLPVVKVEGDAVACAAWLASSP
jgi:hypothetical protein